VRAKSCVSELAMPASGRQVAAQVEALDVSPGMPVQELAGER
jgi:hypothetical protein